MDLSQYQTGTGPRWAVDGQMLSTEFSLGRLMELPAIEQAEFVQRSMLAEPAGGTPLAPVEPLFEIWAAGVTYLRSREAREAESATGDIYQRVYIAQRPELFFKANGWRVAAPGGTIRVRADSRWNVPEPELTLVINCHGEICGYTAGNDVSSRDIEGENPLYLPQAKVYNGSCALGPCLRLVEKTAALRDLPIRLTIQRGGEGKPSFDAAGRGGEGKPSFDAAGRGGEGKPSTERSSANVAERGGQTIFTGETSTRLMKRPFEELADYLFRELDFPQGAFLMTGTGIVPPETFSLCAGDDVRIEVGDLLLENRVG